MNLVLCPFGLCHYRLKTPVSLSPALPFHLFQLISFLLSWPSPTPSSSTFMCPEDVRGVLLCQSFPLASWGTSFGHHLLNPCLSMERGLCGNIIQNNIPSCSVNTIPFPLSCHLMTVSPYPSSRKCPSCLCLCGGLLCLLPLIAFLDKLSQKSFESAPVGTWFCENSSNPSD